MNTAAARQAMDDFRALKEQEDHAWPEVPMEAILHSEVPEEYLGAVATQQLKERCQGARMVLLHGPPGTGKTRICWAFYQAIRKRQAEGDAVAIWDRPGAGTLLEQAVSKLGPSKVWIASECADIDLKRYDNENLEAMASFPGLLCVDDIGYAPEASRWASQAIYHIANQRRAHNRQTLWTTNLKLEDLARHYSPAIQSRLCGGVVLEITGHDRRQS